MPAGHFTWRFGSATKVLAKRVVNVLWNLIVHIISLCLHPSAADTVQAPQQSNVCLGVRYLVSCPFGRSCMHLNSSEVSLQGRGVPFPTCTRALDWSHPDIKDCPVA